MCGRYSLAVGGQLELGSRFGLREQLVVQPRFNIHPGEEILTIASGDDGPRAVGASWGFVPHWARDRKIGQRMINARRETVGEKPAFSDSLRHRRCLIPADGYYEWSPRPSQPGKQPWHIRPHGDGVFAFAAIWALWHDDDTGEALRSCAIITRPASAQIAAIHDREPVILNDSDAEHSWLNAETDADSALALLAAPPPAALEATPVGLAVSDPSYDGPACLDPPAPDPQGSFF